MIRRPDPHQPRLTPHQRRVLDVIASFEGLSEAHALGQHATAATDPSRKAHPMSTAAVLIDPERLRPASTRQALRKRLKALADTAEEAADLVEYIGDVEDPEERELAREEAAEHLTSQLIDAIDTLLAFQVGSLTERG